MKVLVCGARGSSPTPGPDFARYGGHTSCVAISRDGHDPTLVLDGGTGLRRLARALDGRPFRGAIVLGHLHWDHIFGLPFFSAAEHPDSDTVVYLPRHGEPDEVLARILGPPTFPLMPSQLRGRWSFESLDAGEHAIGGFTVLAADIPHPGGRTLGFRVSDGLSSIAYLSDHCPLLVGRGPEGIGAYHESALRLAQGCDLLIHDAQFTAAELAEKAFLGHSAMEYAIGLGQRAGCRRVLLFHHDPDRTDEELDAALGGLATSGLAVDAAMEGDAIELTP